jgi:histidinol phosphatase-like PHP family hydrolase
LLGLIFSLAKLYKKFQNPYKIGIKNEINICSGFGQAFEIPSNTYYSPKETRDV